MYSWIVVQKVSDLDTVMVTGEGQRWIAGFNSELEAIAYRKDHGGKIYRLWS